MSRQKRKLPLPSKEKQIRSQYYDFRLARDFSGCRFVYHARSGWCTDRLPACDVAISRGERVKWLRCRRSRWGLDTLSLGRAFILRIAVALSQLIAVSDAALIRAVLRIERLVLKQSQRGKRMLLLGGILGWQVRGKRRNTRHAGDCAKEIIRIH